MRKFINIVSEATNSLQIAMKRIGKKYGVSIDASIEYGVLRLYHIERAFSSPKGAGRLAMEAIGEYADRNGLAVLLTPAEGSPALIRFYQSLGYEIGLSFEQLQTYYNEWDEDDPDTHGEFTMHRK